MDQADNKNILQSVDSALRLMDLFEKNPRLGLPEISKALGVAKSTAFRLCATLENRGYLHKLDDASYSLGSRFLSLGAVASDRNVLIPMLRPLMTKLMEETEETVHLVIWVDSYRVLLVDHVLCQGGQSEDYGICLPGGKRSLLPVRNHAGETETPLPGYP